MQLRSRLPTISKEMFEWIKTHKLAVVLLFVVGYLLFKNSFSPGLMNFDMQNRPMYDISSPSESGLDSFSTQGKINLKPNAMMTSAGSERIVIQETSMSLVVEDVRGVGDKIVGFAEDQGGFMVQTTYSKPEEYPFGTVVVRVPKSKLNNALEHFRSLSVKVSSENIMGIDVTEQYVDIEERLATLEKTKAKFEQILEDATQIQDILSVQRELINLQEQIDYLIGQQQSIEKNAELVKVTVFLSTDELALPYVPDNTFRPNVIFKQAIRGLVETLRGVGTLGIWVGVFSIVWVPALVVVWYIKRRNNNNN